MTDKPIPFSAPMVRALLDGTKTQTRRIVKLPVKGEYIRQDMGGWKACTIGGAGVTDSAGNAVLEQPCIWNQTTGTVIRPTYSIGDRLWVRESYFQRGNWQPVLGVTTKGGRQKWAFAPVDDSISFEAPAEYRKGRHSAAPETFAWHKRLGRFMPRWASRLTLTVTDVRVERLQDCSEADAEAEGVERVDYQGAQAWKSYETYPDGSRHPHSSVPNRLARISYRELWNSINGAGAWEQNPWVVALTFTVEQRNIDAGKAS
jgi:hypothetical protein